MSGTIEIFTADDLDRLLAELRAVGADHQWVEAKRSQQALPQGLWKSLSAFANSERGGIVLLGVDETSGFAVTGVDDPGQIAASLQSACSSLEPPLRPYITPIAHPGGAVVVAHIAPLARNEKPCHLAGQTPHDSSYVRVGDSDEVMRRAEVDNLLADRSGRDHSSRPAPDGARLDPAEVGRTLTTYRELHPRQEDFDDARCLYALGAADVDGHPTLAGLLALGETPARFSSAARISYRQSPQPGDPANTRMRSRFFEGRCGELLDDLTVALGAALRPAHVEVAGAVVDVTDVPALALREILSNALVHRSLAGTNDETSIVVHVTHSMVVVTSPGGLHANTDIRQLGLAAMSSPRNLSLVRLCELSVTPSGARIIEGQASGIVAADRVAREAGAMPALFANRPASFEAILLRGPLDTAGVEAEIGEHVDATQDDLRLLAAAKRLETLSDEDPSSRIDHLDVYLAARLLTASVEEAAFRLGTLAAAGLLQSQARPDRTVWQPLDYATAGAAVAVPKVGDRQVSKLLAAVAAAPDGEIGAKDLYGPLGVTSSRSVAKVIKNALDKNLIEPTRDSPHDPQRKYRLTTAGKRTAEREAAQRP